MIDYREARRAILAQRVLAAAGILAVYIPKKLVAMDDDPATTQWLMHRLDIPVANAERARALLDEHGLGNSRDLYSIN